MTHSACTGLIGKKKYRKYKKEVIQTGLIYHGKKICQAQENQELRLLPCYLCFVSVPIIWDFPF